MSIEQQIVNITATIEDATISQAGFGTALIAGVLPASLTLDVYGPFSDAAELLAAPYSLGTTSAVYKAAAKLKAQSPSASLFKVGNRKSAVDKVLTFTPAASPTQGDIYDWVVDGQAYTYTAGATPTVATVVAGMVAAMSGYTSGTVASVTTHMSITQTLVQQRANGIFAVGACSANVGLDDTSAGTGVATDLANIKAADDLRVDAGFYGLLTDFSGKAQHLLAAAFAETSKVMYRGSSQDSAVLAGTASNVQLSLQALTYHYSQVEYSVDPVTDAPHAATMGLWFAREPGQITLAAKQLSGATKIRVTTAQLSAINAQNGDVHALVGGRGWIKNGWAASGRFLDVTRTADWFLARFMEGVLQLLGSSDKIAQTDVDLAQLFEPFNAVVAIGVRNNAIKPGTAVLTIPLVSTMSANDRAARLAAGITFSFQLAGAFHDFTITGKISI